MFVTDTQGKILQTLGRPAVEPYKTKKAGYAPTDTAYLGGLLWVTDGYGAGRIHRFSQDLKLELTIDGSEGEAGKFACPHWVWADTRADHTRIYVADRGNHRIQVFNTDGEFIKCISDGLITPSAFGVFDDVLVVAELKARLVLLDKDDAIIGYIGEGHAYVDKPGWPNRLDGKTPISPLDDIEVGKFNSPHGMCVDPQGNIYVSEWLIGDRYTKLKRLS